MMIRNTSLFLALLMSCGFVAAAGYKAREIEIKEAAEYPARQNFQNVIIGAQAFTTREQILEIFDSKEFVDKRIMPVLVVIRNNNEFALRIDSRDIYLVDPAGTNIPALDPIDVMLAISLKKPLSSYATKKEILLRQRVNPKMAADFERKVFDEKLIPPLGSDFGVVFFPLPEDGDLQGFRLYFPTVENLTAGEELMFFEFALSPDE